MIYYNIIYTVCVLQVANLFHAKVELLFFIFFTCFYCLLKYSNNLWKCQNENRKCMKHELLCHLSSMHRKVLFFISGNFNFLCHLKFNENKCNQYCQKSTTTLQKEAIYLCIKDVPKCHSELMVKCSAVIGTRLHYLNKKNPNKLNLLVRKLAHGYLLTSTFWCKWKKGGFSKPFNVHAIFLFFKAISYSNKIFINIPYISMYCENLR